jgi:hypothetical protein
MRFRRLVIRDVVCPNILRSGNKYGVLRIWAPVSQARAVGAEGLLCRWYSVHAQAPVGPER